MQQGLTTIKARILMSDITNAGMNVSAFMNRGLEKFQATNTDLQARMQSLTDKDGKIDQQDLIKLQYDMGQYQASLTLLSNTISSIQSHTKEMANSIH
jgi:hypothetical protein